MTLANEDSGNLIVSKFLGQLANQFYEFKGAGPFTSHFRQMNNFFCGSAANPEDLCCDVPVLLRQMDFFNGGSKQSFFILLGSGWRLPQGGPILGSKPDLFR